MKPVRSLAFGLTLPLRAANLILRNPSLLFWSALPVLMAGSLYFYLFSQMQDLTRHWVEGHFTGWGAWIMIFLARIVLLIASVFTFSIAASIVAAPFNDLLAEKTERLATPPLERVRSHGFRHQLRLITIDVLKSVATAAAGISALVLSWVPVVDLFAVALTLLLLAFQFVSYPQTRRGQGVLEGVAFLGRNFAECLGLGMALAFLFAIPVVSIFVLPVAVVSGTLLYAHAQAPGRLELESAQPRR